MLVSMVRTVGIGYLCLAGLLMLFCWWALLSRITLQSTCTVHSGGPIRTAKDSYCMNPNRSLNRAVTKYTYITQHHYKTSTIDHTRTKRFTEQFSHHLCLVTQVKHKQSTLAIYNLYLYNSKNILQCNLSFRCISIILVCRWVVINCVPIDDRKSTK